MAILSAVSAGGCTPDQHRHFALKARHFLIEVAIFEGEKSLELIQALLVVLFWYRALDTMYEQIKINLLLLLFLWP